MLRSTFRLGQGHLSERLWFIPKSYPSKSRFVRCHANDSLEADYRYWKDGVQSWQPSILIVPASASVIVYNYLDFDGPYRAPQLDHNALRDACFNQPECSKTAITICLLRYQPITACKNINKPILWRRVGAVYLLRSIADRLGSTSDWLRPTSDRLGLSEINHDQPRLSEAGPNQSRLMVDQLIYRSLLLLGS